MDVALYLDQENGALTGPAKSRHRLRSAPEQVLKTPLNAKTPRLAAPRSARRALGTVNKTVATPRASDPRTKPLEVQCKVPPKPAVEDYPEIEKCFPYNPSDFELYSVPDDVCLSRFSLAGLGRGQWTRAFPEEDVIDIGLPPSPLKLPSEDCRDDLGAFLETIKELTVDLPPECDY
ncbi:securin [Brachyhypopomus gauderio]|uniref:securin n=1 Tax=Brachyhypopomus gauderio TaxID=698409 RepID=UPI0040434EF2